MGKWSNLEQYKKLYQFIGKRSFRLLIFGVFTGIGLFSIEVVFAYILQAFLVVMKVVPSGTTMNFPHWLPTENSYIFLSFVISILTARGMIRWLSSFLNSSAYELQRDFQRRRLINWAFTAKSVSSSEFLTLYGNGIESVSGTLVSLQNVAILLSTSFFVFLYLLKISFLITLISFGFLGLIALLTRKLDSKITQLGKSATLEMEQINHSIISNIKNLLLLQIYGTQSQERKQVDTRLQNVLRHILSYQSTLNIKTSIPQTLGVIFICSLCVFSTRNGWIPSGLMITYFYLFLQFVQNFSEVIKLISTISFSIHPTQLFAKWWADHSHDGIRNRFELDPKINTSPLPHAIGWDLKNISFSYPNSNRKTLKNFSLRIIPNSCTVIVGESGSGKSTILSIALGLYDATEGNVSIINTVGESLPLREVQSRLLSSVGYVGPESFLIEGTVKENLLYGLQTEPNDNEIKEALEIADCKFIYSLSNGLNHFITEQGQGLSAGQKQRLSFARALLRKPKILILDEATSNLDVESEEKLVKTLSKLKGTITILAVTHREAMLSIADQTIKIGNVELT